jgi:lipoprotein-anchoring transpeptidase ErfK/SrfK
VVAVLAASIGAPGGEAHPQPGVGPTVPRTAFVAYASHSLVSVYGSETATRVRQTLTNPTDDGAVISFLVRSLHRGRARVYLPTRPNGSTGWIPRSQVRIYADPYRVKIDLRRHRLTVWRLGSVTMRAPVGVGRAVNPTPRGTYYIVSRIRPVEPATVYGAFAFGLSGHSNVFARFGFGGDGRIGLHGTNDPAGVGHDVSHGCIRMTNRAILRLSRLLPLGTPVAITHG